MDVLAAFVLGFVVALMLSAVVALAVVPPLLATPATGMGIAVAISVLTGLSASVCELARRER